MNNYIPVNEPVLSQKAKENVLEAVNTGWISSSGDFVKQFEEDFARFIGVKYGIAVSNGTGALHVALLTAGIGKGDEVIVPAFTMAASWLAVLYTGAKPVFVDVEPDTFNIDPNRVEEKITKKTKAIMPVHIYGHPVDMDPLIKIASDNNLLIIEDAAEAHGAEYKGKKCGSFGQLSCFSFYANKIITSGEGGMVLTDNQEFAEKAKRYRDLYHSTAKRFIHDDIGYNYRMTNLQAAVGVGELSQIWGYIQKKKNIAGRYNSLLRNVRGITLPITKDYASNVYWMYSILIDKREFGMTKNKLRKKLLERDIDTRDFFYSPTDQPVLEKIIDKKERFPVTEKIAKEGLYLPSGLAITDEQIFRVAAAIKAIQKSK